MLANVLGFLTSISGTIVLIYGWIKRSYIGDLFREQNLLVRDVRELRLTVKEEQKRRIYAEALNSTLEPSIAEHRVRIEELTAQVAILDALKRKCDAMVDWMHKMIEYAVHLEDRLKRENVASDNITMPKVPPEMEDRFNVPETLR